MDTSDALSALAALANDTRLAVFRLLVQAGPQGMSPGKISTQLDIAASSLSFQLKELSRARLLTSTQDGRVITYVANFPAMNELIIFLTDNCCGGNPCSSVGLPSCCTTPQGVTP